MCIYSFGNRVMILLIKIDLIYSIDTATKYSDPRESWEIVLPNTVT